MVFAYSNVEKPSNILPTPVMNGCGAWLIANHSAFARLKAGRVSDSQPFAKKGS